MSGEERRKKNKEAKTKVARLCKTCHQVGFHDSRNCPTKKGPEKEATNVQDMHLDGGSWFLFSPTLCLRLELSFLLF